MTIKEYIKIHSRETLNFYHSIVVKPYLVFGKSHYEAETAKMALYKRLKEEGAWRTELSFYSLEHLAKKVDFNIEPKKFDIGFESQYSYDADVSLTLFIDDEQFIKISKSYKD